MSVVSASGVGVSYGAHDVFSDISFDIPPGAKIALVGPNGCGKTSLLRIIAGIDQPSAGQVFRARGLTIGYLPQIPNLSSERCLWDEMMKPFGGLIAQVEELRQLESWMADPDQQAEAMERYGLLLEQFEAAGGYTFELEIQKVLTGLGFDESEWEQPIAHLSGGQKTRAMLASLLLQKPELLLLDEPTNHLDTEAIEWLEGYLKEWPGSVLVVAHDRYFLDQVVDRVWDLDWGRLETYPGNYSKYVTLKAGRLARQRIEYERQQRFISKEEDFIQRNIAGQRTKQAQGRRTRLERLERVERPQEHRALRVGLEASGRSGDLVLGLYELAVGYPRHEPLFTCQEVELRRARRVALVGPNGSGKTTFLRTVLGELRPLQGQVRIGASVQLGYFAQTRQDLNSDNTILDEILAVKELPLDQARGFLGRYLFSGDDVFKPIATLSGGEQSRVALAKLTLQGANFLLMDEPTNYLDIPSQEVLQAVLAEFEGTILLVSHDRYLIRALSTEVWAIVDGELWAFKEGYGEYQAWLAARREEQRLTRRIESKTVSALEREAAKVAQRKVARRVREIQSLEKMIQRLEVRLAELTTALELAGEAQQVNRVRQLGIEYDDVEAELRVCMAKWVEMAETAEIAV